jgi:MFS family permease
MLYGVFFVMAFALTRGYGDPPALAGLRLAAVPVALGLVAPFAGSFSDKNPRLVMIFGMVLCGLASLALIWTLTGATGDLLTIIAELAVYGAGLGCYIGLNNSATMAAAPAEKSGVAGGLLNLLRVLGSAIGVAVSAALLAWKLQGAIGQNGTTADAPPSALFAATDAVLLMLVVFAAIAGGAAVVRDTAHPKTVAD